MFLSVAMVQMLFLFGEWWEYGRILLTRKTLLTSGGWPELHRATLFGLLFLLRFVSLEDQDLTASLAR